jgi:hypothetical protein
MWSGLLELRDAVIVVVAVEVLLAIVGMGEVLLVARRYRRGRRASMPGGRWRRVWP